MMEAVRLHPAFLRTARGLASERLLSGSWWLALAAALALSWLVWLNWARLPVIETSDRARIEYESPPFAISAPVSGRVALSRLVLHERLRKGDVLLELDSTVETRHRAEVLVQIENVSAQLRAIEAELIARKGTLRAEQAEALAGMEAAEGRAKSAREKASQAELEAERYAQLRGKIAELELLRIESTARERSADLSSLRLEAARAERQVLMRRRLGRLQLAELQSEKTRALGELASARANLETLTADIERRVVRAPYDGTIAAVRPVAQGSLLTAGEGVGTLLPDSPLHVVALLDPASALGRVKPGDAAWLRLHGFPFTQYGRLPLRVVHRANELSDGLVRIELAIVSSAGRSSFPVPISHGMPGSVDIAVESLTPRALLLRLLGQLVAPRPPEAARNP